jgi:hypothetical protein
MLAQLKDYAHVVQDLRQKFGDFLWSGSFNLLTRIGQQIQETKVVFSFFVALFNVFSEFSEVREVRTACLFQDLIDFLQFGLFKALGDDLEVVEPILPVLDLIEGGMTVSLVVYVLVLDKLLDLARPEDHSRFKALKQVRILRSSVNVVKVLVRDIQVSLSLLQVTLFGNSRHESMQRCNEVFFHTFWPVVFAKEFVKIITVHACKEIIKRFSFNEIANKLSLDAIHRDFLPVIIRNIIIIV